MSKRTEPVGLGIGKYRLPNDHPFFIASVYHDGAWEALNIFRGNITFEDIDRSILINNDPRYYYEVVRYQYEHLLNMVSKGHTESSYIAYHDDSFLNIC